MEFNHYNQRESSVIKRFCFASMLLLTFSLFSCTPTKKEYYQDQMQSKNYRFESAGGCDEPDLESDFEFHGPLVQSRVHTDSSTSIDFKFIAACCQSFMGDYRIENDTLFVEYEGINETVCSCICCYPYRIHINEDIPEDIQLVIRRKPRS